MKKKLLPLILILSACGQRPVVDCDNSPASRNEVCISDIYPIDTSYIFNVDRRTFAMNDMNRLNASPSEYNYTVDGVECKASATLIKYRSAARDPRNTYMLSLNEAKTVDPRGWTTNDDCSVEPTGDKFVLVVGPTVSALYRYGAQ